MKKHSQTSCLTVYTVRMHKKAAHTGAAFLHVLYFCKPRTSIDLSRILNFWILPAAFMGNSSTIMK